MCAYKKLLLSVLAVWWKSTGSFTQCTHESCSFTLCALATTVSRFYRVCWRKLSLLRVILLGVLAKMALYWVCLRKLSYVLCVLTRAVFKWCFNYRCSYENWHFYSVCSVYWRKVFFLGLLPNTGAFVQWTCQKLCFSQWALTKLVCSIDLSKLVLLLNVLVKTIILLSVLRKWAF